MREPSEWPEVGLSEGVRLLLGWRTARRGLDARPVRLEQDVAAEMVSVCRGVLERLGRSDRRPYSGVPALDPGEYLSLPLVRDPDDTEEAFTESGALLGEEAAAASKLIQLSMRSCSR
jgi:hypothetical protein